MIERKFVQEKLKEYQVEEFISSTLKRVGHSKTKLVRTPLGEKIVIYAVRPGLVVGKKGENIKKLTKTLKTKFKFENPQVEIAEIERPSLDARIVAERIASTMEQFGSNRFKGIGHKTMQDVMDAGALGVEVIISGKVPSQRAKRWRFYRGYLKKCGEVAKTKVLTAYSEAQLKSGTIGVQVRIMPPDIELPDKVTLRTDEETTKIVKEQEETKQKEVEKPKKAKRAPAKKTTRKTKPKAKESVKEPEAPAEEAKE